MLRLWRRVTRVLAGAAGVGMLAMVDAGTASAREVSLLRDRTTTDMPDDFQGPQVHLPYVVPSDGSDGALDTNGQFEQSIDRIQHWLLSQTGNQGLRIDTYQGAPDITFFRMPHHGRPGDEHEPVAAVDDRRRSRRRGLQRSTSRRPGQAALRATRTGSRVPGRAAPF
jgi:hypothetical protein